jgi:hypothetical protein
MTRRISSPRSLGEAVQNPACPKSSHNEFPQEPRDQEGNRQNEFNGFHGTADLGSVVAVAQDVCGWLSGWNLTHTKTLGMV